MKTRITFSLLIFFICGHAQRKDSASFREKKPGYFQTTILKDLNQYQQNSDQSPAPKVYKMNFAGMDLPKDPAKYKSVWFTDPVSQGNTNTCWGFSTISFYESEVFRLTKQKIKLSNKLYVF